MQLFDRKALIFKKQYILQSLLATIVIFIVLILLDIVSNAAVIGAFGASTFIAFTMPHRRVSHARFLIGGYIVGVIVGYACNFMSEHPLFLDIGFLDDHTFVVYGALAVGLSIFIMVVTNTEHPPAAGLALGLVINECDLHIIFFVLVGISIVVFIKHVLKRFMVDLL